MAALGSRSPFLDFSFFFYLLVNQHDCNDTCAEYNVAFALGELFSIALLSLFRMAGLVSVA
jgi:hypothetical protein